jgi:hypothetical protein
VARFLDDLGSLNLLPVDSFGLIQAMKQYGINARYLGHIEAKATLAYIKDLLRVEMLARTCKRLLSRYLVELAFESEDAVVDPEEGITSKP